MSEQAHYRLVGRLESGALAELFEAARDDQVRVVVKLLHARTTDARYARTIAATQLRLAGIEGEGIVRVLDLGRVRGRLGIVREYVDGYSLGQVLQRLRTREVILTAPLVLFVVQQLAEAVHLAHEAGVTHGAITPGNVLIGRDGRVGIADYGALEALQSVPELRAFVGKGRSAYRAPEVSLGGGPTASSDVYSLGALAYELLTLREPVSAERTVSTRHAPLPPPSRLDRRLNPRMDAILLRALEQAAARRFRSCLEFSDSLRSFLTATGGMPSRHELARVVGDLFPNEVQLHASPQVPFSEPFTLEPVDGVDFLPAEPPQEPSRVLTVRPSFSLGAIPAMVDELATIEAMPAFETFEPSSASRASADWEAPPGEVPSGRRIALGQATPEPTGISLSARSRVRVAEDFEATSGVFEDTDPGVAQNPAADRPRPGEDRCATTREASGAPSRSRTRKPQATPAHRGAEAPGVVAPPPAVPGLLSGARDHRSALARAVRGAVRVGRTGAPRAPDSRGREPHARRGTLPAPFRRGCLGRCHLECATARVRGRSVRRVHAADTAEGGARRANADARVGRNG